MRCKHLLGLSNGFCVVCSDPVRKLVQVHPGDFGNKRKLEIRLKELKQELDGFREDQLGKDGVVNDGV